MPDGDRDDRDRLERDFLAEAEEALDRMGEQLRRMEGAAAGEGPPPGVLDALFRDAHSLKALAGTLALKDIGDLTHDLEETLDRLRSRRATPDPTTLDLLHQGLDALVALTRRLAQGGEPPPGLADLRRRLRSGGAAAGPGEADPRAGFHLDPRLRAALSQHEERRLAEAVGAGAGLLLVRVRLRAPGFDADLRQIVAHLERHGEVISAVPAFDGGPDDPVVFTVLLAGGAAPSTVSAALAEHRPEVEVVRPAAGGTGSGPRGAGQPVEDAGGAEELQGVSSSIRVPVSRLDDVLAQVGDLSIAVAALARAAREVRETRPGDRALSELDRQVLDLLPRLRSLQRSTIGARLVPLQQVFARVGRAVARQNRASGKEADLHTLGGDTELDKGLLDEVGGPLLHLLRNALDHGIEPPAERAAAGKPRRGRLVLSAFQKGNQVVIDVIDDGRGIVLEAVRRAAEASGRISPGEALSAERACEIVFAPGFTTATRVSSLSGRGVGLDVVRASIRRLKGRIEARSVPGRGTTFTITVPITLALVQALIVRAGGQRYAIPLSAVRENLRLESARLRREGGIEVYEHPRGPLPVVRLEALASGERSRPGGEERYAVVAGPPGRPFAMAIDGFVGQQEVVIKPIGRRVRDLPGLAGATDLGDATAVLVLDPESLAAGRAGGASGA